MIFFLYRVTKKKFIISCKLVRYTLVILQREHKYSNSGLLKDYVTKVYWPKSFYIRQLCPSNVSEVLFYLFFFVCFAARLQLTSDWFSTDSIINKPIIIIL